MERIGFIGLGIMGAPMASNLCKAGYPPAVYDLNPTAVQRLTAQGSRELPLSAMGAECDVLFTILPNGSVVDSVLFGPDGAAADLRPGSLVVDMSSVTPEEAKHSIAVILMRYSSRSSMTSSSLVVPSAMSFSYQG